MLPRTTTLEIFIDLRDSSHYTWVIFSHPRPHRLVRARRPPSHLEKTNMRTLVHSHMCTSVLETIATQRRKSEAVRPKLVPVRTIVISSLPVVLPLVSK